MSNVESGLAAAIIADDLTGALDTAAPFAAHGMRTSLMIDGCKAWPPAPEAQVVSLALETRHMPPAIAQSRVSAATAFARQLNAAVLFKKIDSTLRGNVAAETLACLRASGRGHALIAPAVPAHGRIMRDGHVFVDGVALHETPLARDTHSPAPPAPLAHILRSGAPDIAVHVVPRGKMPVLGVAAGPDVSIIDCETEADLDRIAGFGLANREQVLFVGASGLGGSLASAMAMPAGTVVPLAHRPGANRAGRILFVIGSRAPRTAEQLKALRAEGLACRMLTLDEAGNDGCKEDETCILILTPGQLATRSATEVAAAVGEAAARLLRRMSIEALVVVGGDTALATFRALGIRRATLDGQIMPGVPYGHAVVDSRRLTFVTKAGDFGSVGTLRSILQALQ